MQGAEPEVAVGFGDKQAATGRKVQTDAAGAAAAEDEDDEEQEEEGGEEEVLGDVDEDALQEQQDLDFLVSTMGLGPSPLSSRLPPLVSAGVCVCAVDGVGMAYERYELVGQGCLTRGMLVGQR